MRRCFPITKDNVFDLVYLILFDEKWYHKAFRGGGNTYNNYYMAFESEKRVVYDFLKKHDLVTDNITKDNVFDVLTQAIEKMNEGQLSDFRLLLICNFSDGVGYETEQIDKKQFLRLQDGSLFALKYKSELGEEMFWCSKQGISDDNRVYWINETAKMKDCSHAISRIKNDGTFRPRSGLVVTITTTEEIF